MPFAPRWPWQERAKGGLLALSFDENSVRYVHADEATEGGATLSAWGVVRRGPDTRESFMKRVKGVLPPAAQAIMVLEHGDYKIIPLDAPNVPADELIGAVRWRA